MCAWHEADADLPAERLEVKRPLLPDGRAGFRNGPSGACLLQTGKHEAEPMYVANSEPTIWQREGGRASIGERGLISGELRPCLTAGGYYLPPNQARKGKTRLSTGQARLTGNGGQAGQTMQVWEPAGYLH